MFNKSHISNESLADVVLTLKRPCVSAEKARNLKNIKYDRKFLLFKLMTNM